MLYVCVCVFVPCQLLHCIETIVALHFGIVVAQLPAGMVALRAPSTTKYAFDNVDPQVFSQVPQLKGHLSI